VHSSLDGRLGRHRHSVRSPELVFVALVTAVAVAASAVTRSSIWLLGAGIVAIYLLARAHGITLRRFDEERREALQMSELHLATIEALALAIDAKDHTAQHHVRRVQFFATRLAAELQVPDHDIAGIRTAALLHDIGKIAVPEHILTKPGPLTGEEWRKVRSHPQVGAEIIAAIPFPFPVAPLVLSHHERWDGMGYPSGLKHDQIPLGARILAIADYYDSLVSTRSYRPAMSGDAAEDVLLHESGKALDPELVAVFLRMLPALRDALPETERDPADPVASAIHDGSGRTTVFDDIALAHREMYALYEIAQTMGTSLGVKDTMTLIASKLAALVPFSTCALFLSGAAPESLQCQFATGTDADLLSGLSTRHGQGLAGWVARNKRSLVNARPASELEAAGLDPHTRLQSALVCPLVFGQHLIGAVAVYHTDASFYRDDHRRLLERVSEQAAAVIHNAMVFERTQQDSLTDPLTGLPNTRFMFTHLTRELARSDRLKTDLSLLVMDIDEFKDINDSYGHRVGDRALREVARALRAAIRPYDVCVRYAGDEFVVVLSGCGSDEVEEKRRELQEVIDATVVDVGGGVMIPISVSIGAAVFPHDGDSSEALIARADGRMYADKAVRKRSRAESQTSIA
jgi:diguanylate cyclase (GGDEF)-like protein/putative nucleotidyltransferase with HDIG domain